jgi:uncharacterized protein YlxW (UPF0749 family)
LICKDIENKAESPRSGLGILSSRSCIVARIRIIFCNKKVRIRQQRAKKSKEEQRRAKKSKEEQSRAKKSKEEQSRAKESEAEGYVT